MEGNNNGLETWEIDLSKERSKDDAELNKETSGKKSTRSGKKQMVVIRNINYITKKEDSSASESQPESDPEPDNDNEDDVQSSSLRTSKRKERHIQPVDTEMERTVNRKQEDGGQWQAFQNYLLRDADEEEHAVDKGMFAMERDVRARRRKNTAGDDPLASNGRDSAEYDQGAVMDMHTVNGKMGRVPRGSNDEALISGRAGQSGDSRRFVDGMEGTEGRSGLYRRSTNDDFMIHRGDSSANTNSSGTLSINGFERPMDRRSSQNMGDDSYIVSMRSLSLEHAGANGRNAIDMDSEFPKHQNIENNSNKVNYEPEELSLMPDRGPEKRSIGYDPAVDYEFQAQGKTGASKKNKDGGSDTKLGLKKSDKDRKSNLVDTSDKKKTVGPIRKGKPSKLSPLDEARARAEKLRNYKADLQKMKKQKVCLTTLLNNCRYNIVT